MTASSSLFTFLEVDDRVLKKTMQFETFKKRTLDR